MIVPGVMAVLSPLAIGLLLGTEALGGLLGGALVTGVLMAIMMANAGGAGTMLKNTLNLELMAEKVQKLTRQQLLEIQLEIHSKIHLDLLSIS